MHSSHDLQPGRRRRSLPPSPVLLLLLPLPSPAFSSPTQQLTTRLDSTNPLLSSFLLRKLPCPVSFGEEPSRVGSESRDPLARALSSHFPSRPVSTPPSRWCKVPLLGANLGLLGLQRSCSQFGSCWACFCRGDVVLQPRWNAGGSTATPSGGKLWVKESVVVYWSAQVVSVSLLANSGLGDCLSS